MDVVVKSRHCSVPDQFRAYVDDRITRLEKLDDRVIRVEVEVSAERNPRQHDQACRVEITLRTKGPVVRAEAAAEDKQPAFDIALDRLMAQLRRAADRKRVHHGQRGTQSIKEASIAELPTPDGAAVDGVEVHTVAGMQVQGDGPLVVREKVHAAVPMTLDLANQSRDAARARGLERSPRARLTPVAIRVVAHARATGDALHARGIGDD